MSQVRDGYTKGERTQQFYSNKRCRKGKFRPFLKYEFVSLRNIWEYMLTFIFKKKKSNKTILNVFLLNSRKPVLENENFRK